MSIDDYIEFADIDKPSLNWRDEIIRISSDWVIEVYNCKNNEIKEYRIHSRQLSKCSDFFFKAATNASNSSSVVYTFGVMRQP